MQNTQYIETTITATEIVHWSDQNARLEIGGLDGMTS